MRQFYFNLQCNAEESGCETTDEIARVIPFIPTCVATKTLRCKLQKKLYTFRNER